MWKYICHRLVIEFFSRPTGKGKAMDLRSKKKDVDSFVGQLMSEGESMWCFSTFVNFLI